MYIILAVDDEVDNLEMVEYALGEEFLVRPVKSGSMALRYLENYKADLILLDIRMPEMDGIETYKRIKDMEKCKDVPVIFLTSANDVETEDSCFELGAVDFISKPFEPKIILRRVRRSLELAEKANKAKYISETDEVKNEVVDDNRTLAVTVNGMNIQVYQKDIIYIEVFGNTCIVRTSARELSVRETLEHINEGVGDTFIRIGRSYIVNSKFITSLSDDIVTMESGKKIKIPRRNKKEVVQEIIDKAGNIIL